MAQVGRRRFATLALIAVPAILVGIGVAVERWRLFEPLRIAVQRSPATLPSSQVVPAAAIARGLPIVSLSLDRADLEDPERGILTRKNRMFHGRDWERPGTVSYFEKGRLQFASVVGVRVHGGGSRILMKVQSFRLFFRRSYGADQVPPGLLFGERSQPLRRLIVHNDLRWEKFNNRRFWRFVNPLGYDLARAIGCIVPETKLVQFYLNGVYQGAYVLTEHFDGHYFRSHFGHEQFIVDPGEFDKLHAWIRSQKPLTMEKVSERIDLDNLVRWFLAVLFCATEDPFQGPGQFRDATKTRGEWFFVTFDLDTSFRQVNHDMYSRLLELPGGRRQGRRQNEPRAIVMGRLFAEDPAFREYYKRMFVEVMNHRLTPAFLLERSNFYETQAAVFGIDDRRYAGQIRLFLDRRPAVLREATEKFLNTGPSHTISVAGPRITLDGEPVGTGFSGWYFPGMTVTAEAPDGEDRFSHWLVNGVRTDAGPRLVLKMDQSVRLEAVLK